LGVLAQLQNQRPQDPQEGIYEVWAQATVVKAAFKYAERFAASLGCLVLWLWTVVNCFVTLQGRFRGSSAVVKPAPTGGSFEVWAQVMVVKSS
jgi:hypothetical protein